MTAENNNPADATAPVVQEPVAQVVSSGPCADLPCLQWLSAEHSFSVPIGTKLYAQPTEQAAPVMVVGHVVVPHIHPVRVQLTEAGKALPHGTPVYTATPAADPPFRLATPTAPAVPAADVLDAANVPVATLVRWKAMANEVAARSSKPERYAAGIALKQSIADAIDAAMRKGECQS